MDTIKLSVEEREQTGNGPARRLRAEGRVPASSTARARRSSSISLEIAGTQGRGGPRPQRGPRAGLRQRRQGGDARRRPPTTRSSRSSSSIPSSGTSSTSTCTRSTWPSRSKPRWPIELVGTRPVSIDGGVIDWERREVTVRALPSAHARAPSSSTSASWSIGHHLTVESSSPPPDVTILDDPESHGGRSGPAAGRAGARRRRGCRRSAEAAVGGVRERGVAPGQSKLPLHKWKLPLSTWSSLWAIPGPSTSTSATTWASWWARSCAAATVSRPSLPVPRPDCRGRNRRHAGRTAPAHDLHEPLRPRRGRGGAQVQGPRGADAGDPRRGGTALRRGAPQGGTGPGRAQRSAQPGAVPGVARLLAGAVGVGRPEAPQQAAHRLRPRSFHRAAGGRLALSAGLPTWPRSGSRRGATAHAPPDRLPARLRAVRGRSWSGRRRR